MIELEGTVKGASLILEDQGAVPQKTRSARQAHLPCVEVGNTGLKIVGRSEAILKALDAANRLVSTNVPAIIQGQTGVGKELFARLIHSATGFSGRHPFEAINCAGLTNEAFQADLAHMGGQSGSMIAPPGKWTGFIVFDEIGELPVDLQPVLLRFLETIMAPSHNQPSFGPPARILSLTNRNLLDEIDAGHFRSDLYYRLGAIILDIPRLKDRGEDILLIFEHYNRSISQETGQELLQFGTDVAEALLAHSWPGNVRELRNTVYALHCKGHTRTISVCDLPFNQDHNNKGLRPTAPGATAASTESLKAAEIALIENVLHAHNGNLSQTAIALGISRPTLYRKLNTHNIFNAGDKTRSN